MGLGDLGFQLGFGVYLEEGEGVVWVFVCLRWISLASKHFQ